MNIHWNAVTVEELSLHLEDEGDIESDTPWYRNPHNSGYSETCVHCLAGMVHTDAEHDASVESVK